MSFKRYVKRIDKRRVSSNDFHFQKIKKKEKPRNDNNDLVNYQNIAVLIVVGNTYQYKNMERHKVLEETIQSKRLSRSRVNVYGGGKKRKKIGKVSREYTSSFRSSFISEAFHCFIIFFACLVGENFKWDLAACVFSLQLAFKVYMNTKPNLNYG